MLISRTEAQNQLVEIYKMAYYVIFKNAFFFGPIHSAVKLAMGAMGTII